MSHAQWDLLRIYVLCSNELSFVSAETYELQVRITCQHESGLQPSKFDGTANACNVARHEILQSSDGTIAVTSPVDALHVIPVLTAWQQ